MNGGAVPQEGKLMAALGLQARIDNPWLCQAHERESTVAPGSSVRIDNKKRRRAHNRSKIDYSGISTNQE